MKGRKCLFKRNGRLEKGIIQRVDLESSRVVVSFYEGKCGRTLDLNEILMIDEEAKWNAGSTKKLLILLMVSLMFVFTVYSTQNYFNTKVKMSFHSSISKTLIIKQITFYNKRSNQANSLR